MGKQKIIGHFFLLKSFNSNIITKANLPDNTHKRLSPIRNFLKMRKNRYNIYATLFVVFLFSSKIYILNAIFIKLHLQH